MAISTQISMAEYLHTPYEPDAEYVNGEIEERNVGEYDHNAVQIEVVIWFRKRAKEWGIRPIQEQRTILSPQRVRIPDVSIFPRELPIEQVFTHPQLIVVEILSPEDRHVRMEQRIDDYIAFGIPHIWVIDPKKHIGWDCSDGNWLRKERFEVAGSPIYLSLDELFEQIAAEEA